ncbi:RVP domain-containing protein, partial [Cephalotus follicularis]
INITITIQYSFKLQTTALIDSGAQINCIQEGLIPTKYFEKTKQKLSIANGDNLRVKFKVTDVHICNESICIKQSFILVKDLDIGIILGQPFLEIIKPFKVKTKEITTKIFQQKILFAFDEKPITKDINLLKTISLFKEHSINLIKTKENHLYFMNQEVSNKHEQQLQTTQIKEKINSLKHNIINNLCSDLSDAFWHRKRHMVSLPYKKDFTEKNIPTKIRPIQMTYELMEHYKKLIRPSKFQWKCEAFYVNKNLEINQAIQRLVINYKTLEIIFK